MIVSIDLDISIHKEEYRSKNKKKIILETRILIKLCLTRNRDFIEKQKIEMKEVLNLIKMNQTYFDLKQ